jgi:hypothetical protein
MLEKSKMCECYQPGDSAVYHRCGLEGELSPVESMALDYTSINNGGHLD